MFSTNHKPNSLTALLSLIQKYKYVCCSPWMRPNLRGCKIFCSIFFVFAILGRSQNKVRDPTCSLLPKYETCYFVSLTRYTLWRLGSTSFSTYASAGGVLLSRYKPFSDLGISAWNLWRAYIVYFVYLLLCIRWSRDRSTSFSLPLANMFAVFVLLRFCL